MAKALMDRFVKDDVMARVSSVQQLLKVDVDLKDNHKVYSKIDIGFMAEKSLKSAVDQTTKKISDKEVMQFRMECKEFLKKLVKKVMEKSPLKFFTGSEYVIHGSTRDGNCSKGVKSEEIQGSIDNHEWGQSCRWQWGGWITAAVQ